jgi:hypothetical protein
LALAAEGVRAELCAQSEIEDTKTP